MLTHDIPLVNAGGKGSYAATISQEKRKLYVYY